MTHNEEGESATIEKADIQIDSNDDTALNSQKGDITIIIVAVEQARGLKTALSMFYERAGRSY